jgi:hypothetical protein
MNRPVLNDRKPIGIMKFRSMIVGTNFKPIEFMNRLVEQIPIGFMNRSSVPIVLLLNLKHKKKYNVCLQYLTYL